MLKFVDKLNSINRLPPSLQNPFWESFTLSVEDELLRMIAFFEEKKIMYDMDLMTEKQLREISELLGVVFNSTVNDSVDFLRREVKAIPFKIQYKDTVTLFRSFPRALDRGGQVYVYVFETTSNNIVRSAKNLLYDIANHDPLIPVEHFSLENFTGYIETYLELDTGYFLDIEDVNGNTWRLDDVNKSITTNHIAIEFYVDRIISKDIIDPETGNKTTREFLMTWEYLDFIQTNMEFSRRVVEVPHIGAHFNLINDTSGIYNPFDTTYTSDVVKSNMVVNPTAFANLGSVFDLEKIAFGIGSHTDLPAYDGTGTMPTGLHTKVASTYIMFDEKFQDNTDYSSSEYIGAVAEYKGQQINDFAIHDDTGYLLPDGSGSGACDGVNTDFNGILPFAPIQNYNVIFKYYSGSNELLIQDNGKGVLSGDSVSGTIDYTSGAYQFTTDTTKSESQVIGTGDGFETHFTYTLGLTVPINSSPVPAVTIKYSVQDKWRIAYDDGTGNISGDFISAGSIDYTAGDIILDFSEPVDDASDILIEYSYNLNLVPDAGSQITVEYYFTLNTAEITEAGLYDRLGELVAYATFPPFEFTSPNTHLNFGFIIKKNPF